MTSGIGARAPGLPAYVATVAFGSTAYIAQFAAATVAAREITGSGELAGLPSAIGTLGTALATAVLTGVMRGRGRRAGLMTGYLVAVLGVVAAIGAVALHSFPLLLAGSVGVGFGNASLNLTRYAAADLVESGARARVIALVVWSSTVGAVLGPNLVDPAGRLFASLGLDPLEGGIAFAAVAFALALAIAVRTPAMPHRRVLPVGDVALDTAAGSVPLPPVSPDGRESDTEAPGRLGQLTPVRVRIALAGLLAGQVVMNFLMTMAPVHVHDMGEPMSSVGFVISAHTLGMFAFAPLTARLVDRFGQVAIILAGFAVLLTSAVLAAIARESQLPVLVLGLFLLGYGWNLAFVAGSTLLTLGSSFAERVRLQGMADALVWTSSAIAAAASGPILAAIGYGGLATLSAILLAIPALAVLVLRRRLVLGVEVSAAAA